MRNADEIRFWADYVAGDDTDWIVDDAGGAGGLAPMPSSSSSATSAPTPSTTTRCDGAIQQLLDLDRVQDPEPTSEGGGEAAELQAGANATQQGDPALDTADFADDPAPGNLRADYVLPPTVSTSSTPACSGRPATTRSPLSSPATRSRAPTTASCGST